MTTEPSVAIPSLWTESSSRTGLEELVYASNLLGSDLRITNFGGGNTSAKVVERDPLTGAAVTVLYVKGSGGDLGTATASGFAALDLARVLGIPDRLKDRGEPEDTAVDLYRLCAFAGNTTACSIDTPLHAFIPKAAVSHLHSDAVISIAASKDAEALTQTVWGGRMGYVPWMRPGLDLGLAIRAALEGDPRIDGVLMGQHGFICWADTWQACYELSLDLINQAQHHLDRHGRSNPFAVTASPAGVQGQPDASLAWLPELRGSVAHEGVRQIAHLDTSDEVQEFLASPRLGELAALGTSCPDHFLRTKIAPMVWSPEGEDLAASLDGYRLRYRAYYERWAEPDSPAMRNPNPSVVLVPGFGMVSFGKSPREARITGEFYRNAIRVMRGAESVSSYRSLDEREAFRIEYWSLEEAKLQRQPPERAFARQVAVITGGAQGIGLATAKGILTEHGCVAILDIAEDRLAAAKAELMTVAPEENILALRCDVTNPSDLQSAFDAVTLRWGGVDLVVLNAGAARRGTIADTDDETYSRLRALLIDAYAMTARTAVRLMQRQGTGGNLVFVASKNGVAAGANNAIYSAAKAFELQLMRTIALDHAADGIRANAVNPDAVITGSGIWSDSWRAETAASLGIQPDEIEEHYRRRSLLQRTVRPEDVANAILWLADERTASRTTGCVITVDAGNREGFLR